MVRKKRYRISFECWIDPDGAPSCKISGEMELFVNNSRNYSYGEIEENARAFFGNLKQPKINSIMEDGYL